MPRIVVGYRTYHPTGDKTDAMGNYDGYGATCDEKIGSYSTRIQKCGTYTKETGITVA